MDREEIAEKARYALAMMLNTSVSAKYDLSHKAMVFSIRGKEYLMSDVRMHKALAAEHSQQGEGVSDIVQQVAAQFVRVYLSDHKHT